MTHLWDRLVEAKERLTPVQSQYRVLFEDPDQPDNAACVLVPDPNWMACALAGGILPPIETYIHDREIEERHNKENPTVPFNWKDYGGASHPYAAPIGPMTEEEAIEYLIQKDLPPRVWRDYKGNRCIMKIVPVELIPSNREYRNAWRISQTNEEFFAKEAA